MAAMNCLQPQALLHNNRLQLCNSRGSGTTAEPGTRESQLAFSRSVSRFPNSVSGFSNTFENLKQIRQEDGTKRTKKQFQSRCVAGKTDTALSLETVVQRQGELLRNLDKRMEVVERRYQREISELKTLVEELREGVCRPEEVEEDEGNDSSWTTEQRMAKIRILGQIKADDVVENIQMLSREILGDYARAAVSNGKISMAGGVEIMQASLVASGMDLEPLHLVADALPNVPPDSDQKYAILPEHVDLVLSRTHHLKVALGNNQVLPLLLGESIHPDAASHATAKGVHVILRRQDQESAVW